MNKDLKEHEAMPDAWLQFERAVDVVVKSGPQHRLPNPQRQSKGVGFPITVAIRGGMGASLSTEF